MRGVQLKGKTIRIDGTAFYGCQFTDCVLIYSGGEYLLDDCMFPGCTYQFEGPARNTMVFASVMGLLQEEVAQQLPKADYKNKFEGEPS